MSDNEYGERDEHAADAAMDEKADAYEPCFDCGRPCSDSAPFRGYERCDDCKALLCASLLFSDRSAERAIKPRSHVEEVHAQVFLQEQVTAAGKRLGIDFTPTVDAAPSRPAASAVGAPVSFHRETREGA